MKRQWIMAGVICLCLALLGVAWFVLGSPEDTGEDSGETEIAAWENEETVQEVQVQNDQGGYTLRWTEEEAEAEGLEGLPLDTGTIGDIRDSLGSLTASREITDGQGRLADFGLEEPAAQAEITAEDGDSLTLLVGDEVPDEETSSRYVSWENRVFTVESSQVEGLLYGNASLLSRELTPDSDENFLVTRVAISRQDGEDIVIEYSDSQELAGYTVNSYQMVSPREYPADSGLAEDVFPGLFGLEADSVAAIHPSDQEKETLGTASPWKTLQVDYTDGEGEEHSFSLAVSQPENGVVSVVSGETDIIYQCSEEDMSWLDETEETLVSHTVLAPDIKTLAELEITAGEEQYVFRLQNVGEDDEKITCGGEETDGSSFRSFYYTLIGFSADDVLFENFPDTASLTETVRVRYVYTDGTEDVLACYEEAPRQIYAELNQGERGFRLTATQVETMLETVQRLAAGEEIEARY